MAFIYNEVTYLCFVVKSRWFLQLTHLEKKLKELKAEKHELFNQLKKVLHEDETKRRAMIKETKYVLSINSNTV